MSQIDKISNQILIKFVSQMKSKGFDVAGIGGGEKNGKINLLDVTFHVDQLLTIELSRKFISCSVDCLMDIINTNEKYRNYFEVFPISENIMHISIIGHEVDEHNNLEEIQFATILNSRVYYEVRTQIKELKPLKIVHEETFEEAKSILSKKNCKLND